MSRQNRDFPAVSHPAHDATEVLSPQDYRQAHDAEATAVLPASQPPTRVLPTDPDATVVLPARPHRAAADDPTLALPASTDPRPERSQGAARLTARASAGAASSLSAAKTSWAAASIKAKETAQRVKQERANRAAEKARPTSYIPAAHSGEFSPSGKLHMLTPSHIRQTRPSLWTLIQHFFAAGTLFCLLSATLIFFIGTPTGQQLDEISFQEFAYQFMTYTEQTSSLLDMVPAAAGVVAATGILFVLIWKHRFVPALVGLAIAAGANFTTQILKNYLITKPNLGIQEALGNSAPSGHTTFAAAAGLALFIASPKRFRPTVALLSMVFTVAAGYSTIVNGWHRPADVVSAILVTGIWGVFGLVILRFMRSEELDMSNTQRSGLILVPLLSISGVFAGFCALALYCITYTSPIPGSAFMAAICMIGAVAALTTSIQVALLRPQNKQRSAYRKVWAY